VGATDILALRRERRMGVRGDSHRAVEFPLLDWLNARLRL
jgi:hypothetical protein